MAGAMSPFSQALMAALTMTTSAATLQAGRSASKRMAACERSKGSDLSGVGRSMLSKTEEVP